MNSAETNVIPQPAQLQEHEPSRLHQIGRWAGRIAAIGTVGIASGLAGTMLVPAHVEVGPHQAEVQVTSGNQNSVDFGPLGSISKSGNSPLGVKISLKEIPETGSDSRNLTQEDVNRYVQMFSDPEQDAQAIRSALWERGIEGAFAGEVSALGLLLLLGSDRRKQLAEKFKHSGRLVLAVGLITSSVGSGYQMSATPSSEVIQVNPIFKDTPLDGTTIKGKLLVELINTYGPKAIEYYRANQAFYKKAAHEFTKTYDASQHLLQPDEKTTTAMFVTDLHCNLGMDKIAGQIQEKYKVDLVLDGGDITMGGSSLEQRCVDTFKKNMGRKTVVAVDGNHDSQLTAAQQHLRGITVLNGKSVSAGGLTILGDRDPMRSEFGDPIHQIGPESNTVMGERLGRISCAGTAKVDIMLVHEPEAALAAAKDGCVKLVLSGHTHQFSLKKITNAYGEAIPWLTGGTAGGAKHDTATIGPLKNPAEITILKFDKYTQQPISYQNITFDTNANVQISPILEFAN